MSDAPREIVVPRPEQPQLLVPSPLAATLSELESISANGAVVRHYDGRADPPDAAEQTDLWVPPFLTRRAKDVIAQLPALRVVQLLSAGAEQFIGVASTDVVLCNARGAPSGATAEWAVAAMTASFRGFDRTFAAQARGSWDYRNTDELLGKKILIIGAGDVARAIVRRLDGWEVEVTLVATRARDGVRGMDELPALLPEADVVLLIVPITEQTRGLADAEFLGRMQDGALLVNAARGPVVDTDALIAQLESGRLRAVLDVTDPEPLPEGHRLWSTPNLMIHPHIAGSAPSTVSRAYDIAVDQIDRYLTGRPLQNVVYDY